MSNLSILIADDHTLVRQGLRTVIETQPGWTVCHEAANGREAVRMAAEALPDIVMMDISMPELNGLEATRLIRRDVPSAEVIILTMHEEEALVADVLESGARGYILKSDTPRLLVAAIEAVSNHQPFFTGRIAEMVLSGLRKPDESMEAGDRTNQRLTPREREIVQLIAEGRTNKEVASALNISAKTVDAHRTNVMRRLNVHSVTDLVRYAIRNKIIEP